MTVDGCIPQLHAQLPGREVGRSRSRSHGHIMQQPSAPKQPASQPRHDHTLGTARRRSLCHFMTPSRRRFPSALGIPLIPISVSSTTGLHDVMMNFLLCGAPLAGQDDRKGPLLLSHIATLLDYPNWKKCSLIAGTDRRHGLAALR